MICFLGKSVKNAALAAVLLLFMAQAGLSPAVSLAAGPVTSKVAYDMAYALASKWQPDAKLCNFTTLATGTLDSEGRASDSPRA